MNNLLYKIIAFLLLIAGVNIIVTKRLPQGKYGAWIEIGNYSYFLGILFILYGIYILYSIYKNKLTFYLFLMKDIRISKIITIELIFIV